MGAPPASDGSVRALGLEFPHPVGLAAGFDRDASRIGEVLRWGFGFVELGTITPQPVPDHNPGAAVLAANVARYRACEGGGARPVIGVSLGMQPGSPPDQAWLDYVLGMQALWSSADYLVLNLTSRSAQVLQQGQYKPGLLALLAHAREEQERLAAGTGRRVPLLVKWPVRPQTDDAVAMARRIRQLGYEGMLAAFDSEGAAAPAWEAWVPRACRHLAETLGPQTALVAVGGVDRAPRARELLHAGAPLVQVYRGFVDQGPALVTVLARAMLG